MSVRNMQDNPHIWEQLGWEDMNATEQQLWSALGWDQDRWDENNAPASTNKDWSDLNQQEQYAARGLGFNDQLWNGTEDQ
ncbi:MAG: hypothetical protein OEL57_04980 [Trichlorobacter sp.]|uniref:hypothetical protein n=1 Tax=Trichlorobacter sp. TaxID=2911007 RepID=UPI002568C1A5|nr:hypothetical protein [Trichlorobacter sp.]MDK9717247.1 hypothetical protein [Trichlorobacter sp.]